MNRVDSATFSAMQIGKPFSTYKKTVLGKIYVSVLSPFDNIPTGELLVGDPKRDEDGVFIDIWDEMQDLYFNKMNKLHFEAGRIIKVVRKESEKAKEQPIEQYSDEQLGDVLDSKFFTLRATIDKVNSKAVMFRLIDLAREMEKSEKLINTLEARLAHLQSLDINTDTELKIVI